MTRYCGLRPLVLVSALALIACGKGGDEAERETRTTEQPAAAQVAPGGVPMAAAFARAGLTVVHYGPFPAQIQYRRAGAITYRARDGRRGGVLIAQGVATGVPDQVAWHWYFADAVPDSSARAEINGDGLWDVRVYMHDGGVREFVQGRDFTLLIAERDDRVALNGASSDPALVWYCFDGDTATAWEGASGKDSWIEIPAPLGVEAGLLRVRLTEAGQPERLAIEADGKTVAEVDLEATSGEQLIEVPELRGARSVRLRVASMRGRGPARLAELGIR
jgi:hypothetical protein